jgi:hypothetical protein
MKDTQMIEVRNSPIHGYGVFARRRIRKGTTIIEYLGDRVSHEQVDERYADKSDSDSHTFLFTVNSKIVIDAGSNGNDARFINHSCDPNCESTIKNKRVFIEAIRTIQPGEELNYDYSIGRDAGDAPNVDEVFACRCRAGSCRGSMLEPRKQPRVRRKRRATTARGKVAARGRAGERSKAGAQGNISGRGKGSRRGKTGVRRKRSTPGGASVSRKPRQRRSADVVRGRRASTSSGRRGR